MTKERIYKIFEDIIREASKGKVDAFFTARILFETKIEGNLVYPKNDDTKDVISPVLNITNVDLFKEALFNYVTEAISFYENDPFFTYFDDEYLKIKAIIANVLINASYEDFMNPSLYLDKRRDFFHSQIEETEKYIPSLESNLVITSKKNRLSQETPYYLSMVITDGNDKFVLPDVYYALDNDVAYIYGIQNRTKNEGEYAKKINRYLYHVNDGFVDDTVNDESLKDITPSFVLSANIILGLLKAKGINKVVINSILPIRYNSKELLSLDPNLPLEDREKYSEENNNRIQNNMTDKFIRTFRRVMSHHSGLDVSSYPMDVDSSMHMVICDEDECFNPLLNETYNYPSKRNETISKSR